MMWPSKMPDELTSERKPTTLAVYEREPLAQKRDLLRNHSQLLLDGKIRDDGTELTLHPLKAHRLDGIGGVAVPDGGIRCVL